MSIYKRGEIYWLDITTPNSERIRCSTGTSDKRKAQEYHDKLKAERWDEVKLNKEPKHVFDEAVLLFLKEAMHQRNYESKQTHAKYWLSCFSGREIDSIRGEEITQYLPIYHKTKGSLVSGATKNRYRASIMRILSLSHKMGWVNAIPYVTRSQEPKIRVRWLPKEDANYLIDNLQLNWMKQVCSFALLTGARMSEIFTLTWANVNLSNRLAVVTHANAKSGKARALVLNEQAMQLIASLSRDSDYVFTRETHKRIYDIDRRDFKRALQLSKIDNFHFHDLRHTWASWHVQAGTPLFTLKEMGGWESLEMVRKYAHLNASHMLDFADNVTFTSQLMCHNKVSNENSGISCNNLVS